MLKIIDFWLNSLNKDNFIIASENNIFIIDYKKLLIF